MEVTARVEVTAGVKIVGAAESVVEADVVFGVDAVVVAEICGAETAAVFAGRKPKALTGADVRVLFPPMLAVTLPPVDEGRGFRVPGLTGPAPLPAVLDPVVMAFGEFAGEFPPGGSFALAGSSWFAPGNEVVAPETPWVAAAPFALAHRNRHDQPTSNDSRTKEFRSANASDMVDVLSTRRFTPSRSQCGSEAGRAPAPSPPNVASMGLQCTAGTAKSNSPGWKEASQARRRSGRGPKIRMVPTRQ